MTVAEWPQFGADQINAATRVLSSGKVNTWTGQETTGFEQEFAKWCGTAHATAMANGSLALSAAYLAIGLGPGDELITTPRTFIATASSAVLLGAKPLFADVDAQSGAITAATIAPLIDGCAFQPVTLIGAPMTAGLEGSAERQRTIFSAELPPSSGPRVSGLLPT